MLLLGFARKPGRLRVETCGRVPAKVGLNKEGLPTRLALLLQTGRRHTDPTAKKRLQGQKGLTARQ